MRCATLNRASGCKGPRPPFNSRSRSMARSTSSALTARSGELLEQVAFVMLKITGYVMALAPLAVFASMPVNDFPS